MALNINGTNIHQVVVNGSEVDTLVANDATVWRKMRDWAFTATSTTSINDICEYRVDHAGRRSADDTDRLFGEAINSIKDGEDIAIVLVSYGNCCNTGMKLLHNGVYIPARAYNYGSPDYDNNKAFWTVGLLNELDTSLCSRTYQSYGQITYHGSEVKTSTHSTQHILTKHGTNNWHYNSGSGCSDEGKGGWSAYILHGESFHYLLDRLGVRNTPNIIRSN